jgi:hypothetical protein
LSDQLVIEVFVHNREFAELCMLTLIVNSEYDPFLTHFTIFIIKKNVRVVALILQLLELACDKLYLL